MTMTRRDALKSFAGALVAFILPAPRRHVDLSVFCDRHEHPRWDMRLPYELQDFVYATDARVCVRVRPEAADVVQNTGRAPPFESLSWNHADLRGWRSLPELPALLADDSWCPACDGTGLENGAVGRECEPCGGTGEVWVGAGWDLSRPTDCRSCRGQGIVAPPGVGTCRTCGGAAHGRFPSVVCLGGHYFDANLYEKVRHLGGEFVHDNYKSLPGDPMLKFRFDAGDGLLMGYQDGTVERRLVEGQRP